MLQKSQELVSGVAEIVIPPGPRLGTFEETSMAEHTQVPAGREGSLAAPTRQLSARWVSADCSSLGEQ